MTKTQTLKDINFFTVELCMVFNLFILSVNQYLRVITLKIVALVLLLGIFKKVENK